jgi:hypothetical protein
MTVPSHPTPFTQAEDNTVRRMCEAGYLDDAIADAIGRTRYAVESRRYRLGIRRPRGVINLLPIDDTPVRPLNEPIRGRSGVVGIYKQFGPVAYVSFLDGPLHAAATPADPPPPR